MYVEVNTAVGNYNFPDYQSQDKQPAQPEILYILVNKVSQNTIKCATDHGVAARKTIAALVVKSRFGPHPDKVVLQVLVQGETAHSGCKNVTRKPAPFFEEQKENDQGW